ncbi:hypothetical protein EG68_02911 [Paragonimus skrjabini miyazakii]|uniref:Uncharacterized protein n=1 Tax=Paragonimus skrjabini miyazakii TaxID=59628 RepID=A0A8S9Z6X5_9TREM|nr:hypothetical protein EG68_02911 [Paragonimus skrjabini miyazakii]
MNRSTRTTKYHHYLLTTFLIQLALTSCTNGWSHALRLVKREETYRSDTLTSKPLELTDWPELAEHLRDYLSSYDHKMVCEDSELVNLDCQLAMTNLAKDYFNLAIKQTESGHPSRVWRQADTGELYGAMLVLDPAQDSDNIPQVRIEEKRLRKQTGI